MECTLVSVPAKVVSSRGFPSPLEREGETPSRPMTTTVPAVAVALARGTATLASTSSLCELAVLRLLRQSRQPRQPQQPQHPAASAVAVMSARTNDAPTVSGKPGTGVKMDTLI
jgi:hypothetical protein